MTRLLGDEGYRRQSRRHRCSWTAAGRRLERLGLRATFISNLIPRIPREREGRSRSPPVSPLLKLRKSWPGDFFEWTPRVARPLAERADAVASLRSRNRCPRSSRHDPCFLGALRPDATPVLDVNLRQSFTMRKRYRNPSSWRTS